MLRTLGLRPLIRNKRKQLSTREGISRTRRQSEEAEENQTKPAGLRECNTKLLTVPAAGALHEASPPPTLTPHKVLWSDSVLIVCSVTLFMTLPLLGGGGGGGGGGSLISPQAFWGVRGASPWPVCRCDAALHVRWKTPQRRRRCIATFPACPDLLLPAHTHTHTNMHLIFDFQTYVKAEKNQNKGNKEQSKETNNGLNFTILLWPWPKIKVNQLISAGKTANQYLSLQTLS